MTVRRVAVPGGDDPATQVLYIGQQVRTVGLSDHPAEDLAE